MEAGIFFCLFFTLEKAAVSKVPYFTIWRHHYNASKSNRLNMVIYEIWFAIYNWLVLLQRTTILVQQIYAPIRIYLCKTLLYYFVLKAIFIYYILNLIQMKSSILWTYFFCYLFYNMNSLIIKVYYVLLIFWLHYYKKWVFLSSSSFKLNVLSQTL